MEFLTDYGLFFAKTITFVIAILFILTFAMAAKSKGKGKLIIKKLNDRFQDFAETLNEEILPKKQFKAFLKQQKKLEKERDKNQDAHSTKRIFVLNFNGDIRANGVHHLREEITALLTIATPEDEIMVRVESPGGLVHAYGLAASQLQRIKDKKLHLTVAVDKVAASGGYMMACVADRIIAAPFAIIGSIGVLAQLPNMHRWLKKHDIDFEQLSAGEYKRTLTVFGENTNAARKKMQTQIDETHDLFKAFIMQHRAQVDIEKVATGEYWYGTQALDLQLVDQLLTSDDYLLLAANKADVYSIEYRTKKSFSDKLSGGVKNLLQRTSSAVQEQQQESGLL